MDKLIKYLVANKKTFFYFTCAILLLLPVFMSIPSFSGKLSGFNLTDNHYFKTSVRIDSVFEKKNKVILILKPKNTSRTEIFNACHILSAAINKFYPRTKIISPCTFYGKMPEYFADQDKSVFTFLNKSKKTPVLCDLVSADRKSFLMLVDFKTETAPNLHCLDSIIAQPLPVIESIKALSIFHLESSMEKYIRTDCLKLSLAILLFFFVYYLFVFRKIIAIVYTAFVVGISVFTAVFFFSVFHYNITLISILVIPIVLVLSLSDSLHLISGYIHNNFIADKNDRLFAVIKKYIVPSFFSSATTAAAFFSFYIFNESEYIREFGLVTGASLMAEFFISFMISPFLLSFVNIQKIREEKIMRLSGFFEKNKKYFSFVFLGILVLSFSLAPKLSFKTNSDLFFPASSALKNTHDEFTKQFYSQLNLDIILARKKEKAMPRDSLNSTDFLFEYTGQLCSSLRAEKEIVSLTSATDTFYFKSTIYGKVNIFDGLDDQNLYYNSSQNKYRIEVRFKNTESALNFIEKRLPAILSKTPVTIKTEYSSTVLVMDEINKSVSSSLVNSILISGIAIFFLIFIMTRSLSLSLLSLIPNLVPLSIVVLLYYVCGMNINILTAITAVVCLGLLDDDTIHILYRRLWLKEELNELSVSILSSAFILIVGFGLFSISSFVPIRVFGWVSSLVFLFGVIIEITLMQWLIELWEKFICKSK